MDSYYIVLNRDSDLISCFNDPTLELFSNIASDENENSKLSLRLKSFSFAMPPDQARKEKDDLRLAFFGTPFGIKNQTILFVPSKYAVFSKKSKKIWLEEDFDVSKYPYRP